MNTEDREKEVILVCYAVFVYVQQTERRKYLRLHFFSAKCSSRSAFRTASLHRGHWANLSLESHSVSKCSLTPEISVTWGEEKVSMREEATLRKLVFKGGEGTLPEHSGHIVLTWDSSSSNACLTFLQWTIRSFRRRRYTSCEIREMTKQVTFQDLSLFELHLAAGKLKSR